MCPVDWMAGNLSGRQQLTYENGERAFDGTAGTRNVATNYQPRLIARYHVKTKRKCFQIRTKSTTTLSSAALMSMALMGGAGALYSSLLRMKDSQIYDDCFAAWLQVSNMVTFRGFMIPKLRAGLSAKDDEITIATGVTIINPWVSSTTPNVPVTQTILDKFNNQLS